MSDPLSDRCLYCGSFAVLDDHVACGRIACEKAYVMHLALSGIAGVGITRQSAKAEAQHALKYLKLDLI